MNKISTIGLGAAMAVALVSTPANAQKAKDVFKVAFLEATQNADTYTAPKPENNLLADAIFDSLVRFDEHTLKMEPLLAKSWKQINPTTMEFKLRTDVKWHDGEQFDADDVVYTYTWLTAKKTKLRFKRNFAWIKSVKKVDQFTVHMIAKRPTPFGLIRLSTNNPIYPEHLHAPLKVKSEFGRKPVGTGMYRVASMDMNKGIVFIKNAGYKHGGTAKPASNIGRVEIIPVTDKGTQIASLLGGDVHILRALGFDEADNLGKDPRFTFTLAQSLSYIYLYFDVAGRSGMTQFKDKRVREAIALAVNRDEVPTVRSGNLKLPRGNPKALCWKLQRGCDYSAKLPEFNPAKARKLLAEAGYPKGFDVQLTAFNSVKDFAEVIAGQLRKVGIRASVNNVTFPAYRKQQRAGKIQLMANAWSAGAMPDVASTMGFFFSKGGRDYIKNPEFHKMSRAINSTMDDAKRRALTMKLLDKVTEERYIIPVSALPLPIVHTSDVTIRGGRISPYGFFLTDVNWK